MKDKGCTTSETFAEEEGRKFYTSSRQIYNRFSNLSNFTADISQIVPVRSRLLRCQSTFTNYTLFMVHCKMQMSYNKDHNLWKAPILSLVAEKADSLIISLKITIYTGMWDKSHSFLMAGRPALVQVNLLLPVPCQKPTSQLQLPQATLPGFTLTFEWPCLYYKFRGGSMTEIPAPSVF